MSQVRLEPMTAVQFAEFMEVILPPYIAARSVADHISLAEAESFARDQHQKLLHAGQFTPDHHFKSIVAIDSENQVGGVWFHIEAERRQTSPSFLSGIAAAMRRRHSP
jgi:hypothetical protein